MTAVYATPSDLSSLAQSYSPRTAEVQPFLVGERDESNVSHENVKGLVLSILSRSRHALSLEGGSAWGSAVAMPQIARSTGYEPTFVILSLRAMFCLIVCVYIQMMLLAYIGESTQVMAPLGGEMHLCDFGSTLDACPDGPHCTGPGGTAYTRTRMYGFTQWNIQNFVKQAFLNVHPDMKGRIDDNIDPGEYGVESYGCRLLCLFLFVMSVVEELFLSINLAWLLYDLPRDHSLSWIQFSDKKDPLKPNDVSTEFRVAGMPLPWKIFNTCFILCPKVAIMHYTLREGTCLLMDTPAILDMILGAMSMSFLLSLDELFWGVLSSNPTKHIMPKLKPLELKQDLEREVTWRTVVRQVFPLRFLIVIVLTGIYVRLYYVTKCKQADGQWVSKDMYLPETAEYSLFDFLFDTIFHTLERSAEPFWKMPSPHDAD